MTHWVPGLRPPGYAPDYGVCNTDYVIEVSCDGKIINPTNSVKYLGITLDENLKGESIAKSH